MSSGGDPSTKPKQARRNMIRRSVKTSCSACSQRRIKCDEKRPSCTQCVQSKKICPGYPPPQKSTQVHEVVQVPPVPPVSPLPRPPDKCHGNDEPESTEIPERPDPRGPLMPFTSVKQDKGQHIIEPEKSGVAYLCDITLKLFNELARDIAQRQDIPEDTRMSLERSRGLLVIWADGYGVPDGELDEIISKSRTARVSTVKGLSSILTALVDRFMPLAELSSQVLNDLVLESQIANREACYLRHGGQADSQCDADSSSSDDDHPEFCSDNLREVAEDLKIDVQCLMELDPLFRNPVQHRGSKKQKQLDTRSPAKPFYEEIRKRFPQAPPGVVWKVGEANCARYFKCLYMRNITREIEEIHEVCGREAVGNSMMTEATPSYSEPGMGSSLPTTTSRSTIVKNDFACLCGKEPFATLDELKRHIIEKVTPCYPCPYCKERERQRGSLNPGHLLRHVQDYHGFDAEKMIVELGTWDHHVPITRKDANDVQVTIKADCKNFPRHELQPYTCPYEDCFEDSYGGPLSFSFHLQLKHDFGPFWAATTCPLCLDSTGEGKTTITNHIASHLEEISLAALPPILGEDGSDSISVPASKLWEKGPSQRSTVIELISRPRTILSLGEFEAPGRHGILRCVCGRRNIPDRSPELRIRCSSCKCWQHADCVGIVGPLIPGGYVCEGCSPNLHVQGIQGDGRRFSRYQGPGGTKPAALTAESEQNSRQRTGCLTCRQRKTKCDGAKPECSNCIRGNFVCAGYPPRKGTWRMPAVGTREAGPTDETIQQRVEEEDEGYEVDDAEHLSKDKDVKKY